MEVFQTHAQGEMCVHVRGILSVPMVVCVCTVNSVLCVPYGFMFHGTPRTSTFFFFKDVIYLFGERENQHMHASSEGQGGGDREVKVFGTPPSSGRGRWYSLSTPRPVPVGRRRPLHLAAGGLGVRLASRMFRPRTVHRLAVGGRGSGLTARPDQPKPPQPNPNLTNPNQTRPHQTKPKQTTPVCPLRGAAEARGQRWSPAGVPGHCREPR